LNAEYDLVGKVIGLAMKVHRSLGPGFLESVYRKALHYELLRAGFKTEMEVRTQIRYEGVIVGDYVADIVVNDELIVEIKALNALIPAHEAQTVNYLAATGKDEGLLLNFGTKSLEFKKKFRTYRASEGEPPALHEHFVNSVNSV
jgi:GxxExxY protein